MKRMTTILLLATFVLPVAGCFEEKVYTVEEFTQDRDRMNQVVAECENNPGEAIKKPNCMNAIEAQSKIEMKEAADYFRKGVK